MNLWLYQRTWALSQYKTVFPRYGDSHVKDKTVARPSYLLHGNPYTGLYGPRCPLSPNRPINLISLSLSLWEDDIFILRRPLVLAGPQCNMTWLSLPMDVISAYGWPLKWLNVALTCYICQWMAGMASNMEALTQALPDCRRCALTALDSVTFSVHSLNSSPPWTKWPPLPRRHFEMHFHEWKGLCFDSKFTEFCFLKVQLIIFQHWFR